MGNAAKIDRARRNLLKSASIAAAALVGATGQANAQWWNWGGDGEGGGGSGGGSGGGTCFLRGSRVCASDGYRAVETLAAGDMVATRFGGLVAVVAVDSFTLKRVSGEWVGASRPVCVKRNALGENMPAEDLCLTGAHAIAVDGALVPVVSLVNGTSIVFEKAEGYDSLDFFHIELPHHDILNAQGAACESLRRPGVEPCLPLLGFNGHRSELKSRLRSVLSLVADRRQPLDIIRDTLEERGLDLARAA